MPPVERFVCRFAAEPPQEAPPHGAWADTCRRSSSPPACGSTRRARSSARRGELRWFPDRTWNGPHVRARDGAHVVRPGAVRLRLLPPRRPGRTAASAEPSDFAATADFTDETAERNPEWRIDLCEEVVGGWRGEGGRVRGDDARLGRAAVSRRRARDRGARRPRRRPVRDPRRPLHADRARRLPLGLPRVKLWDADGRSSLRESLYVEDEDEDE